MFLQIQDTTILLGAGGSGKSEAVKVLQKKYQNWMLIVAPTGILASGYNSNTYFTTFGISSKNQYTNISEDKRLEMMDTFKLKRSLFIDEAQMIPMNKIGQIYEI